MAATSSPTAGPPGPPPQDPQAQPPAPPPAPKQLWYTYDPLRGGMHIAEDKERWAFLTERLHVPLNNLRSFSLSGDRKVHLIGKEGESKSFTCDELQLSQEAAGYILGVSDKPADQPADPSTTPAPGQTGQTPSSPSGPQQQQQPPAGPQQQQQPPPPAGPLPVQLPQQADQITALMQQNQLLQQQLLASLSRPQPIYYPPMQAAPGAQGIAAPLPIIGQEELQARTLLRQHLATQVPYLQEILAQIPDAAPTQADHLNLRLQIVQIQDQNRVYQDLVISQRAIQEIVDRYLVRQLQAMQPLSAQLDPHDFADGGPRTYLTELLNPPVVRGALPTLDVQLEVYTSLIQVVNQHLQAQITTIDQTLRTELGVATLPDDLQELAVELAGAPAPSLTRLIAIDGLITDRFRTHINTKMTELQNSTHIWPAAEQLTFEAPNPIVGLTRAELLTHPARIRTQFADYIAERHAELPQDVQAKVGLPAAAAAADAKLPQEILRVFAEHIKGELPDMPAGNIKQCKDKYDALVGGLKNHLHGLIDTENKVLNPSATRLAQRTGLVNALRRADLDALLQELGPGATPTLTRLKKIREELDIFLEKQRYFVSRHSGKIMSVVALFAIAALAYAVYSRLSTGSFDSMHELGTSLAGRASEALTTFKGVASQKLCDAAVWVKGTDLPIARKVAPKLVNKILGCQIQVD